MFTSLNNPKVESGIRRQMELIVHETTQLYGPDCTIILAGSFGRGEGSVRIVGVDNPIPLNDYDLYVVTDRKIDSKTHREMEERILQNLSKLTGSDLIRDKFVVGVEAIPRCSLKRLLPDISSYEMKVASQILHGPDIRNLIPVTRREIALGSGAITLFHRDIALLENMEPEYLERKDFPEEKRLETARETCKVYTEICTSLSLLGGFYQPSYRTRAQEFSKHYSSFPELERIAPNLPEKVAERTEMKITSDFSPIINQTLERWLEAQRDLDVCQRYFLSRMLGVRFQQPWTRFSIEAEIRLKWIFFIDYLSFYLKRIGIQGTPFVYGANVLFQAYDNYSFNRRVRRFGRLPSRGPFSLNSPFQNIYLATAAVLYSLKDDGSVDENLLKTGTNYLEKVLQMPQQAPGGPALWKQARDSCLEAQKLYFIREQKRGF
jgi:hypothetical protein